MPELLMSLTVASDREEYQRSIKPLLITTNTLVFGSTEELASDHTSNSTEEEGE